MSADSVRDGIAPKDRELVADFMERVVSILPPGLRRKVAEEWADEMLKPEGVIAQIVSNRRG